MAMIRCRRVLNSLNGKLLVFEPNQKNRPINGEVCYVHVNLGEPGARLFRRSVSDIEGLMNDLNNKKTGVNLKLGEMR